MGEEECSDGDNGCHARAGSRSFPRSDSAFVQRRQGRVRTKVSILPQVDFGIDRTVILIAVLMKCGAYCGEERMDGDSKTG